MPQRRGKAGGGYGQVKLFDLVGYLDDTLAVSDFADDASANGLQFEGSGVVRKVAVAVDACQSVIDRAAGDEAADFLLVHHGLIWGGLRSITGGLKNKFSSLLRHNTSLYACHLPLDAHPDFGNNARILKALSVKRYAPFGTYHGKKIGFQGVLSKAASLDAFVEKLDRITGGGSKVVAFGGKVKHIAVVSGGGAGCISEIERSLVDTYITGEPSHAAFLQAEEMGKNIVFAGHYATETFGVRAVGDLLAGKFGLDVVFIEHPTGF